MRSKEKARAKLDGREQAYTCLDYAVAPLFCSASAAT